MQWSHQGWVSRVVVTSEDEHNAPTSVEEMKPNVFLLGDLILLGKVTSKTQQEAPANSKPKPNQPTNHQTQSQPRKRPSKPKTKPRERPNQQPTDHPTLPIPQAFKASPRPFTSFESSHCSAASTLGAFRLNSQRCRPKKCPICQNM